MKTLVQVYSSAEVGQGGSGVGRVEKTFRGRNYRPTWPLVFIYLHPRPGSIACCQVAVVKLLATAVPKTERTKGGSRTT